MSSIQERLQLKRCPLDTWNIREQLCLASAVVRSGDQNWMSVSRALKTVGEPNRPTDWYSQKSCAAQYGALLEHVETPKRKKRSSEGAVETPQESILKRLTQERIVEIQKTIAEMNQQYEVLKNEINEARSTSTSEDRLREMWNEMEAAKKTREREAARRAQWLKEREEKRARAERTWRPPTQPSTPTVTTPAPVQTPASPLLTSLLKSSPVVTTPQHIPHPANVVETVSPSVGAPTLSMLLEKAGNTAPDPKHAAIEHIKSQLVQIEHQLKASTSTPPAAPPAVDIDDIEIKAEDVYAFRDVDIHIPPVTHMHKSNPRQEKPSYKSDEPAITTPVVHNAEIKQNIQVTEENKEESAAPEAAVTEEIEPVVETPTEPRVVEEPPAAPAEPAPEALKIAFPEVKFPTPEIKVIQPDELKVKEEIKEEAPPPETKIEAEPEITVEVPPTEEESTIEQPTPEVAPKAEPEPPEPAEQPQAPAAEDIPLPAEGVTEVTNTNETPLPQEEVPLPSSEDIKQEVQEENPPENQESTEVNVETTPVEVKKEEDTEESIPLREMVPEDAAAGDPETEGTHTETDDDTPMELSREEEKDGKKRRDYSRKKKPDSRTCSGSESAAEASAPESPSANDAERQHRLWKKSVMLVYSRLCAHKYASIFLRPITDEEAPGYSIVIKRPMDLTTIRRNIEAGVIRTTAEFQRDVLLMLSNALMYNSSEHSVYSMAKEMFEEAQNELSILVAAQAHAGLVAPPVRRKRRRASPLPPAKRLH